MDLSPGFKQFLEAEMRKPALSEEEAAQNWGFAPGEYAQRVG